MKKLCIFSMVMMAILILGKPITKNEKASDLLKRNVEALASVKNDDAVKFCYGSGSVDCYDGTKVEWQTSFWSLDENSETE